MEENKDYNQNYEDYEGYDSEEDYAQNSGDFYTEINTKTRDLEEKQRILKDRLLLIGENLIEAKEKTNEKITEIKKDVEIIKQSIERMTSFIEAISGELSKFAKREDIEILKKQARIFQV